MAHHRYLIKFPINASDNNISQLKAKKNMYGGSRQTCFILHPRALLLIGTNMNDHDAGDLIYILI